MNKPIILALILIITPTVLSLYSPSISRINPIHRFASKPSKPPTPPDPTTSTTSGGILGSGLNWWQGCLLLLGVALIVLLIYWLRAQVMLCIGCIEEGCFKSYKGVTTCFVLTTECVIYPFKTAYWRCVGCCHDHYKPYDYNQSVLYSG